MTHRPEFGWVTPPGYEFDNKGECRSCGAAIAWHFTKKGNRAPLNPDGVSHFATCPSAALHRTPPAPPTTADPHSRAAAEAVLPKAETKRGIVLALIRQHAPVTEYELERLTGWSGNTVRPRLWELEKAGLIVKRGEKPGPNGIALHTYKPTEVAP